MGTRRWQSAVFVASVVVSAAVLSVLFVRGLWPSLLGMVTLAVMLLLAALTATLWLEHRRRHLAELEARRYLTTMALLDRRASMGALTASLAHELHQPLGAILRNSEAATLLIATGGHRVDELREILDDIRKDDRRATEIIRRMRTLVAKHDLHEEPVDMNEVARETVDFLAPDAASRDVRVQVDLQKGPAVVNGDRVHLQQVLMNLVLNGMDAMQDTPADRRRLIVATFTTNAHVDVLVQDGGSGIPAEQIEQVFEPFFTTKADGMGVGLSIARTIVEAHNGRIRAENNADRGVTVRFSLPLRDRGTHGGHVEHQASIRG